MDEPFNLFKYVIRHLIRPIYLNLHLIMIIEKSFQVFIKFQEVHFDNPSDLLRNFKEGQKNRGYILKKYINYN
jgi:hypothetical protein